MNGSLRYKTYKRIGHLQDGSNETLLDDQIDMTETQFLTRANETDKKSENYLSYTKTLMVKMT